MMICRTSADTLSGGVLGLHPVCFDRSVLGRRVHIGKQPVAVPGHGEPFTGHDPYPHIVEQPGELEAAVGKPSSRGPETGRLVDGTQRMISAFGLRYQDLGLLRTAALAGNGQERRVEPAEAMLSRHA